MSAMTMASAVALWRQGNDAGRGYAPYADVAGEDTIDAAVEAAQADGWELVEARETSDQIALLRQGNEWMGIGGDASGHGAWAVILSEVES